MKKQNNKTIAITSITIILIIVAALTFYTYSNSKEEITITSFEECLASGYPVQESYPRKCITEGEIFIEEVSQENEEELETYFVEQLWKTGTENLGAIPIEGFNPDLYKGAFPLFEDYDFHNTQAHGGIWEYQNNELAFLRDNTQPITSADGTLTNEGVKQLYNNLKIRMDFKLETKEDIDNFINFLSGNEEPEQIVCTDEMRNLATCTAINQPVCGWSDPEKVQCIKYPCAQTYGNACDACANLNVEYYTEGECPA